MIVPKQKLSRKQEIAITPIGEEIEEEELALNLDEFDDVEIPEER